MLDSNTKTTWSVLILAAAALTGCTEDQASPTAGDFVSDNPYGGDANGGGDTGTDPSGGDGESGGDDSGGDDGSRDIAEADIVHVEGDRLYALSRYGGLTVIDISAPDQLPVLGRFKAHAEPFEMYVDGEQVFVMYQGFGEYIQDPQTGAYTWTSTSRLMALDASNPADITTQGDFSMPGYLSDSRRVGDVLYVVTKEDQQCWSCDVDESATVVTSLDVSDEANVQIVDQLRLQDEAGWGGQRSVSATDQRLYIAGPDWGTDSDQDSTIEVVDISDPGGTLVAGASVAVAGVIDSRWQMDEHEGVLRVISQPGWDTSEAPSVETFSVAAADDVVPLASLQMQLPRPERLQSVRFDGPRAYAITFEQTDPLFTIDLSDPAAPQQVGELEIPGFVWHMEARGDRVLGIGFDRDADGGSINASLFDVSDFANPTMIERVHFGGDWASFAEDQDRIHKSFQVLDELGLLLVPFSGWDYDDAAVEDGCGDYHSGIQLIDWVDDTLSLRGVAPMRGSARRALVHDDRLIGVSDLSVDVFDIADRDAPSKTTDLALASQANRVAIGDGVLVRLATDWWTSQTRLEVVDAATPDSPLALGALSLDDLVPEVPGGAEAAEWGCVHYGYLQAEMYTHAGFVYLVRQSTPWDHDENATTTIDVVDVTDPTAPSYVESLAVPGSRGWGYGPSLSSDERHIQIIGDSMVMLHGQQHWEGDGPGTSSSRFELIDLSDPGHPVHARTVARPDALAHGGLQAFDGVAVSWHMQAVEDDPSKVRFYLDRLDVPSAAQAQAAPPVNVPGAVVAWDEASSRAVVADFQLADAGDLPEEDCWSNPRSWYDYEDDRCLLASRPLHLVQVTDGGASLLDTVALDGDETAVRGAAASDERLFVHLQQGSYGWYDEGDGGYGPSQLPSAEVVVFSDWATGDLDVDGQLSIPGAGGWLGQLRAIGTRLIFQAESGLGEIDASDASAPAVEVHDLWGYYCGDLKTDGEMAYCAMGSWGIQAVEL